MGGVAGFGRSPVTLGRTVRVRSSRHVGRLVAQEGTWGSIWNSSLPAGTTGRASPVLAVLPVWVCPWLGGLVPGGALSAREACTWDSARIWPPRTLSCSACACSSSCSALAWCSRALLIMASGCRVSADGMTYPGRWQCKIPAHAAEARPAGDRASRAGGFSDVPPEDPLLAELSGCAGEDVRRDTSVSSDVQAVVVVEDGREAVICSAT